MSSLNLIRWRRGAAVALLACAAAHAETLQVPSEYGTIQAAMEAAVDGDVVEIADGTYTGAGNKDLDFLGKAITVRSAAGDPALCIIDCEQDGRGVLFHSGEGADSVLEAVTITNGASTPGGGVFCSNDSSPTLRNCVIHNCTGGNGGGLSCSGGSSPTLLACTISGNRSGYGGGIYCGSESSPVLEGCLITLNEATALGGGICCDGGSSLKLSSCAVENNLVEGSGGAIACRAGGSLDLTDCAISYNNAYSNGGGVYYDDNCNADFTNCTIRGNTALGVCGGGVADVGSGSRASFTGCTISDNMATSQGGGLTCGADTMLRDCVISRNRLYRYNSRGGGVYFSLGGSPIFIGCTFTGNEAKRSGGAVYGAGWNTRPVFHNCTISANVGGGIALDGADSPLLSNCTIIDNVEGAGVSGENGSVALANCILRGNAPEQLYLESADASVDYCNVQGGWAGVGNIDADPLFVDPDGPDDDPATGDDNDFRLSPGSPCIDAGDNTAVPADVFDLDGDGDLAEPVPFDLAGNPRFIDDPDVVDTGNPGAPGPIVDMGAYEFQGHPVCPGDLDGDGDTDQSDLGILLAAFGVNDSGDLDGDGDTDQSDLGILLADYGCGA